MNGVSVRVVGTKIVVEVDILKAIAEGVGGARPISTVKPGPKPKPPASSQANPNALVMCSARPGPSSIESSRLPAGTAHGHAGDSERFRGHRREPDQLHRPPYELEPGGAWS